MLVIRNRYAGALYQYVLQSDSIDCPIYSNSAVDGQLTVVDERWSFRKFCSETPSPSQSSPSDQHSADGDRLCRTLDGKEREHPGRTTSTAGDCDNYEVNFINIPGGVRNSTATYEELASTLEKQHIYEQICAPVETVDGDGTRTIQSEGRSSSNASSRYGVDGQKSEETKMVEQVMQVSVSQVSLHSVGSPSSVAESSTTASWQSRRQIPRPPVPMKPLASSSSSSSETRPIANLGVLDVERILRRLKLDRYVEVFRANDVDGRLLLVVDESMLVDEFHLRRFDAKKLMLFVKNERTPSCERSNVGVNL